MLADIVVGLWTLACFSGVCLFMYWAFGGQQPQYVEPHGCDTESERKRCAVRDSLRHCRNDDDVFEAVFWALDREGMALEEVEEILDELRPLSDPADQAAWAVRLEQLRDARCRTPGETHSMVRELGPFPVSVALPRGYGKTRCEGGAS